MPHVKNCTFLWMVISHAAKPHDSQNVVAGEMMFHGGLLLESEGERGRAGKPADLGGNQACRHVRCGAMLRGETVLAA